MKRHEMSPKINMETPDYGFESGLDYTVRDFSTGEDTHHHIDRETLRELPNVGDDTLRDSKIAEQLKKVYVAKGLGERAVGFSIVGPEDAKTIKYQGFGWGGDSAHPVAVGEMQALAASDPESAWMVINTPGSGGTDALPRSVAKELTQNGSYGALGEHYAKAVSSALEGREVHLRGHSLGGRTALGLAPHIESGVESLIINDPTGSAKMSIPAIVKRFLFEEGEHLKKYIEAGFDKQAAERQASPAPNVKTGIQKLWQMLAIDPIALTRSSFEEDLRNALPNIKDRLRVISPELSALNDWQAISEVIGRVASGPDSSEKQIEQLILHGHTHSFMATSPAIEGFLYK